MTITRRPICTGCERLRVDEGMACSAFPEGIPAAILDNETDHRRPVSGDKGIRFMPNTPDDAAYADAVFGPIRTR